MNQEEMILNNRKEAEVRNANLRKQAADRLKKNATWNKANKIKKTKEEN